MHVSKIAFVASGLAAIGLAVACGGAEEAAPAAKETTDPALSASSSSGSQTGSSSSSSGMSAAFVCMDNGGAGWGHVNIPSDAGGGGPLACAACAEAQCTANIDACGASCECRTVVTTLLQCFQTAQGDPLVCLTPVFGASIETQETARGLFDCTQSKCASECSVPGIPGH